MRPPGFEPGLPAWKAGVMPLHYGRTLFIGARQFKNVPTIVVKVKPSAPKTEIVSRDPWVVAVKAPARGGRANAELLRLLKKQLDAERIWIIRGHHSPLKIIGYER